MGPAMQTGQQRRGQPLYGPQSQQYDPNAGGAPQGVPDYYNSYQGTIPLASSTNQYPFQTGPDPNGDPNVYMQNAGKYISGMGSDLMNQNQAYLWDQNLQSQQARNQAYPVASNMLAGHGGYTPEEMGGISRTGEYERGMTTPGQFQAMGPTGTEQAQMTGDPTAAYKWFDPAQMQGINDESAQRQRAGLGQYGQQQQTALGGLQTGYNAALGNRGLNYDPSGVNSALNAGNAGIAGSYDPNSLQQSRDFANKYQMTDADVQAMENQSATTQHNLAQGKFDQIQQAAANSGYNSPMALANAQGALQRQGDVNAGDAALNAQVAAKQMQAARLYGTETNRQQTAANAANTGIGVASNIAGRTLGTASNTAGAQLGAQQNLAGMQMSAAGNLAGQQLNAANQYAGMGTGIESGIGNQKQNTQQYITNTGTGIESSADQNAVNRANNLYGIRQGNEQYAANTGFNQNLATQDRLSNSALQGANMRVNQQNAGLGYFTGQQGMANQNVTSGLNRAGQLYGTQAGAMNQVTGNKVNQDSSTRSTSFGTQMAGATARALGNGISMGLNHNQTVLR